MPCFGHIVHLKPQSHLQRRASVVKLARDVPYDAKVVSKTKPVPIAGHVIGLLQQWRKLHEVVAVLCEGQLLYAAPGRLFHEAHGVVPRYAGALEVDMVIDDHAPKASCSVLAIISSCSARLRSQK